MTIYINPPTGEQRNPSVVTSWVGGLVMLVAIGLGAWYYYANNTFTPKTVNMPSTAATTNPTSPAPHTP